MADDGDVKVEETAEPPAQDPVLLRILQRLDQLEQAVERNPVTHTMEATRLDALAAAVRAPGANGGGVLDLTVLEPWLEKVEDAAIGALDVDQLESALTKLAEHQDAVASWVQQLASQVVGGQQELRSLLTAEGGFAVQQAHLAEVRDRLAALAADAVASRKADTAAVVAAVEKATLRPIAQLQAGVERLSAEVERMRAALAELGVNSADARPESHQVR
jgi:hypothetical protein